MPYLHLVLLVTCLLLPLRGMAQIAPPLVPAPAGAQKDSSAPGSEEDPSGKEKDSPQGALIPRERQPSESLGRKIPRISLEFLGGGVLGFLASVPGAYIVAGVAYCSSCDDTLSFGLLGLALGSAGMSLGSALGIRGIGGLLSGEGRFLPTLLGTTLGTVAGLVAGLALGAIKDVGANIWFIPVFTFPTIGGIIAYEMTHASALEQRLPETSSGMSVVPVIGVSPRGGVVGGLAGVF
jgi:hypothetical protein